jgi:hypothetical protein
MVELDFIFLPDYQVFETTFLAKNSGDIDNTCLKFFKKCWSHYIDEREKIIVISQELDKQLVENHYKSEHQKRQALFSIVRVHSEGFGCNYEISQMKLASILSIEENKKIYYITDNDKIRGALKEFKLFTPISSEDALRLLN